MFYRVSPGRHSSWQDSAGERKRPTESERRLASAGSQSAREKRDAFENAKANQTKKKQPPIELAEKPNPLTGFFISATESFTVKDSVLLGFKGFYWVSLGFTGFYWVSLGFTGFYWVLQGFTGYYWVLLGFTGFY